MTKLTIKQLSAIKTLAGAQSFTIAAARLNTTQSNLSITIREAEKLLGVRLFDRSTKTVTLTEVGTEFSETVGRLLDELDATVHNVQAVGRLERGQLSIGVTPLLGSILIPDLIAQFHDDYPEIDLRLEDASTTKLLSLLSLRDIEIAIGTFDSKAPDIALEPLFDDALIALSHPSLGLAGEMTWAELAKHRPISMASESSVGRLVEDTLWSVCQTRLQPLMRSHHWLTVVSMTHAMRGVCVVPHYALELHQTQTLRASRLMEPVVERRIYAASLRCRALSIAAQRFIFLLKARLVSSNGQRSENL
ncbi:LysR family transcriptional regulator [Bordetella tumulicola]|uniref:LysR family transcriptional regulator n=1 Tax=Bordetella tumulicola TaxID=1649133 RepID=UPI0039EE3162